MLNIVVLTGRLVKDPELRRTANETAVASVRIAVDRDHNREETDFIDIVAWRQTAEFLAKYFKKGELVTITGRLQIRSWQDSDGNKRQAAEVVADRVYFSGKKEAKTFEETDDDGDLPF